MIALNQAKEITVIFAGEIYEAHDWGGDFVK